MEAYTLGKCPQCGDKIMVRDAAGRWNSTKPNFRQMDLVFENGQKMRTIICEGCSQAPDYEKLMSAILHKNSKACSKKMKGYIENLWEANDINSHDVKV